MTAIEERPAEQSGDDDDGSAGPSWSPWLNRATPFVIAIVTPFVLALITLDLGFRWKALVGVIILIVVARMAWVTLRPEKRRFAKTCGCGVPRAIGLGP